MSVPVSYVVGQSFGQVEQEEEVKKDEKIKEHNPVLLKTGRMDDNQVRVVGWLDITEGSIQGGNPLSRPLEEGEYVMIAAKVKQDKGMDTMMTRCGMDDGHGEVKILTDERGCSKDSDVVGNVQTKYNEAIRVKEMFANFKVPKFGGERHLTIKCGVVVCDGTCPVSPCDDKDDPIHMRDMIILETEADVRPDESPEEAVAPSVDSHSYTALDMIQVNITIIRIILTASFSDELTVMLVTG